MIGNFDTFRLPSKRVALFELSVTVVMSVRLGKPEEFSVQLSLSKTST